MRILRLDLLAFGPFTERSLEFGAAARLYLVHGANEAGKSSSLRALRHLLYGIPQQTPDNFLHPYQNLRIGGVLETADGARLEFIRRKGRAKTLRAPDDSTVLDESTLEDALAGVDEAAFAQRFGIDYDELRRGGEAIAAGGGDLGEVLFAAGAGVADLRQIQEGFDKEADELFKPRGSTQRIAQSLADLEKCRKEIRESQLLPAQWVKHDEALQKAVERQQKIDEQLSRHRTDRSRLNRISRSFSLIARLGTLRAELAKVADAPMLHDEFAADRREAEANLANAKRDRVEAEREIDRLENELTRGAAPTELVEHRTAVAQLRTDLGSYRKACQDRPSLVADRDGAQRIAGELLQRLDRPAELGEAESLRLSKRQRRRIQELAGECQALIERQQSSVDALHDLDEQIGRARDEIALLPPPSDVDQLERTIRQVQKRGDVEEQRRSLSAELETFRDQADVDLARLPLYDGTFEALEKLPAPPVELIDRFESQFAQAESANRENEEKIDELNAKRRNLEAKLEALRLTGETPTETDLTDARGRRDSGWALVRQLLEAESSENRLVLEAQIDEFAAGDDLATAFRQSMDHADAVADRLRREADRVAQQAQLAADLQEAAANLERGRQESAAAAENRRQVEQQWRSHWAPTGVDPLAPREMRAWLAQQQDLVKRVAEVRRRDAEVQRLVTQIGAMRADLNQCLEDLEQPGVSSGETLATALDRCQEIASTKRDDELRREHLAAEREKLCRQRVVAEREAAEARQAVDQWRADWADSVLTLGLDGDARPSEANAVMDTVDEIFARLEESRKLEERIDGIDSDAQHFERSVRQLLEQAAPDLLDASDSSVDRTVAILVDRLDEAEKHQTKREGWVEQLQKLQTARNHADVRLARSQQTLAEMCKQAGCRAPVDLPQAEQRAKTRREIESDVRAVDERLLELAAGADVEEWMAIATQFDADGVQADLVSLDELIEALEREKQQVAETVGEHRNELARMDGSGKAAEAQSQAEHLLAAIRSDAEEYVRRRLASAVLERAMERFREASQGPVLDRASQLFRMLTRGSFESLRADYGDSGNAVLVGQRPSGKTVAVAGMSEGTCDQLYLSLRLALLESTLDRREPLPFIVDDILIMFDDARAKCALEAMAQVGEKTQVVLFTHHEHLVRIARETLDDDALCVLEL